MHLATIDYLAGSGKSFFHRAAGYSKIIFSFTLLTAVILSGDPLKLGVLMAALLFLFVLAGIPLKEIAHLALYPAFFSLIFALFQLQNSWLAALLIILKAVAAALSMLFLITTTSYIEIFGFFSLFMPSILVDIFVFTYRSFFILLDKIERLVKLIRLRGGYHLFTILRNIRNMAGAIGVMILHSFDMSERMYRIYSLRGYNGRIPLRSRFTFGWNDALILLFAIISMVWTVIPWKL